MSRVIPFPAKAAVPGECFPSFPVPLHDAVAATRRSHRRLVAAASEWALAQGVFLPADHVALWAAAAEHDGQPVDDDGLSGPWRFSRLLNFLAAVTEWCVLAGCPLPADFTESLWHLYDFLADTGRLNPGSHDLPKLRAALVVFDRFDCFRPLPYFPPEPTAA